jgi:hypothetical protein
MLQGSEKRADVDADAALWWRERHRPSACLLLGLDVAWVSLRGGV